MNNSTLVKIIGFVFVLAILGATIVGCAKPGGKNQPASSSVSQQESDTPSSDLSPDTVEKPKTPEDTIKAYYKAINDQEWDNAWDILSSHAKNIYTSDNPSAELEAYPPGIERFKHAYGDYVKSVKVKEIKREESLPDRYSYWVTFEATYIKPFPAGNGELPTAHVLMPHEGSGKWYINQIGTGF